MALRLPWEDERYVRVYCRDTIDWQALSWNAQALYVQLCRKATRKGRIDLGRAGRRGVAALAGRPEMVTELLAALDELEQDGCIVAEGAALVIADFEAAQEAVSSNAARQRRFRERQRDEQAEEQAEEQAGRNATLRPAAEALRPYSTVQHGTEGTARLSEHGAAAQPTPPPPRPVPAALLPAPALSGEALSRAFEADLEVEASREDKQRARTLDVLGGRWRTIIEIAEALKRSPRTVEADLHHLRQQGVVERQELGAPGAAPIMHWRRKQRTPATAEGSAEAAG